MGSSKTGDEIVVSFNGYVQGDTTEEFWIVATGYYDPLWHKAPSCVCSFQETTKGQARPAATANSR